MKTEHELICDTGTPISRLKYEINQLDEMIKGYETYSENSFFLNKLKNFKQRLTNLQKTIEDNFNTYVDYHEPKV